VRRSHTAISDKRSNSMDHSRTSGATVRVADYAAIGPHIAGLGFDHDAAVSYRLPRVGVALEQVVDGVLRDPEPAQRSAAKGPLAEPPAPKAA